MLIDWFTVVAQIVNFLILVALMKRFLYGPLIRAIDSREKRIAAQIAEAERRDQEASAKAEKAARDITELENNRAKMIEEARSDVERQRNEMVQSARQSVLGLEEKWREDLEREETVFLAEMRRAATAEVLVIARRALADLASADLQRAALQAFLDRLQSFDSAVLKNLCAKNALAVCSAKELAPEWRARIEQTVGERIGGPANLRFECAPEMSWGIEMRGDGQRIGWTPDQYLDSLEEKLREVIEEHAGAGYPLAVG